MTDFLLRAYLIILHYAGWYVLIIALVFSAAFAIVGIVVCIEETWRWVVRRLRRWRVDRDRDRARAEYDRHHQARGLAGSQGAPRRVWEAGEPWDGDTAA